MMANGKILICHDQEESRESLKLALADHYSLIAVDSFEMACEVLTRAQDIRLLIWGALEEKADELSKIKKKFPHLKIISKTTKAQEILKAVSNNLSTI